MIKLSKGRVVEFGNGSTKEIASVAQHSHPHYSTLVEYTDGTKRSYMPTGKHHYGTNNHDIIKTKRKGEKND